MSVVLIVVAFVAGSVLPSPWQEARSNSEARLTVTAQVVSRPFVSASAQAGGTVSLGSGIPVTAEAAQGARVVVTGTPARPGATLSPGDVVIEVNDRPVIFLRLPFPLYRDLRAGDRGDDVVAVQRALAGAGVYSGSVDGVYGPRTSAAVAALYRRAGASAPVGEVQAGGDAAAGVGTTDGSGAGSPVPAAPVVPAPGSLLPSAEVLAANVAKVSVVSMAKVGASPAQESGALGQLRGGSAGVSARVLVTDKDAFAAGTKVTVTAVADTGRSVDGQVLALGPFTAGEQDEPAGYDASVAVGALEDGWQDGDRVTVTLAGGGAASRDSMAVPLTVLREDGDGTFVQVAESGTAGRRVAVKVGVSDGGWAEVLEGDLQVGQRVVLGVQ